VHFEVNWVSIFACVLIISLYFLFTDRRVRIMKCCCQCYWDQRRFFIKNAFFLSAAPSSSHFLNHDRRKVFAEK